MHDLLRAYARELADDEPGTEVHDAVRRLVGFYLHGADAAGDRIHPGRKRNPIAVNETDGPAAPVTFHSFEHALTWCEAERANLAPVVRLAADHGLSRAAWQLADSLWPFFYQADQPAGEFSATGFSLCGSGLTRRATSATIPIQ